MDRGSELSATASSSGAEGTLVPDFVAAVIGQVLRETHRYAPGVEPYRPSTGSPRRARAAATLDRCRDVVERLAGRVGFSRRHFDPDLAAAQVMRVIAQSAGLQATYGLLGDEPSRQALIDIVKLRALGPYHSPLRITPAAYRARQEYADRVLRRAEATFDTPDPYFSSLSLYELPVPGGPPIRLHSHSVDVVSVYLLGQYTYARGESVAVGPGDVVLDIGACYGDTALSFASRVGAAGKVYAFEFDSVNLEILRANLKLNPELSGRIEIVERALWDSSGETLPFASAGRSTSLTLGGSGPTSVTTLTLDDFVSENGLDHVDFVKMDVEGAELNVLRGAATVLPRFRPALALAAYHRDDDLVSLPAQIDSLDLGYRFWLDNFSPLEEETVLFAAARSSST
ncbi:MAG: FkbM family methyltransferase [Solirubrobacteraceae bacterium]